MKTTAVEVGRVFLPELLLNSISSFTQFIQPSSVFYSISYFSQGALLVLEVVVVDSFLGLLSIWSLWITGNYYYGLCRCSTP